MSRNATFGVARLNTTVRPSGPSGISMVSMVLTVVAHGQAVAGSLRRSKCLTTASALSGVSSWNMTPSRRVIVYWVSSSLPSIDSARKGSILPSTYVVSGS